MQTSNCCHFKTNFIIVEVDQHETIEFALFSLRRQKWQLNRNVNEEHKQKIISQLNVVRAINVQNKTNERRKQKKNGKLNYSLPSSVLIASDVAVVVAVRLRRTILFVFLGNWKWKLAPTFERCVLSFGVIETTTKWAIKVCRCAYYVVNQEAK